jgi:hypothetical protein
VKFFPELFERTRNHFRRALQIGPIATDSKTPKADCENQPIVLHNTGAGEWTTGTGVVRVKCWYSIVKTGW